MKMKTVGFEARNFDVVPFANKEIQLQSKQIVIK